MTIKGCERFRVSREFRASYVARFLLCPQLSRNLPRYRCKVSSPRVKNSPRNFLAAFSFDFDRLAAPRHCAAKFQREGGEGADFARPRYKVDTKRGEVRIGGSNGSVESGRVYPRDDGGDTIAGREDEFYLPDVT